MTPKEKKEMDSWIRQVPERIRRVEKIREEIQSRGSAFREELSRTWKQGAEK